MKTAVMALVLVGILLSVFPLAYAQSKKVKNEAPLPPSEASLPTIKAEPWLQVEANPGTFLEGPSFDREGNLYVSSIFDGRIFQDYPGQESDHHFQQERDPAGRHGDS